MKMKIKLDKQFLKTMGIAAVCSLAVTFFVLALSLISWVVVFAVLLLLFMPAAQGAIKFYEKTNYRDLEDFFIELMEDEDETKTSQIDW